MKLQMEIYREIIHKEILGSSKAIETTNDFLDAEGRAGFEDEFKSVMQKEIIRYVSPEMGCGPLGIDLKVSYNDKGVCAEANLSKGPCGPREKFFAQASLVE